MMPSKPGMAPPHTGHDQRSWRERVERKFYRGYKSVRQRLGPSMPRTHVFVAGMQRSGTNMLMEVLDWNRHTDVYHETDSRAFTPKFEMRAPDVIHDLARRSPAPFFVIKSLCELDRMGLLLNDFAPAKVIWIVRDFHESSRSAVRSFANFVPQLRRLAKDTTAAAWRGRGMSRETQELLREIAALDLSELDGAAMMWYYRNVLYFELGLDRDERAALLHYDDLIRKPGETLSRLVDFIGLPDCTSRMKRHVHAPTSRRHDEIALRSEVEMVCTTLMNRFMVQR